MKTKTEAAFADLFEELVRPDHRAGAFRDRIFRERRPRWLDRLQKITRREMGGDEFVHAGAKFALGAARLGDIRGPLRGRGDLYGRADDSVEMRFFSAHDRTLSGIAKDSASLWPPTAHETQRNLG